MPGTGRLRPDDRPGLDELSVDGCITKAPCGGERAGARPLPGRPRQTGHQRSIAADACGVPLGIVAARANRLDSPLLGPTLQAATLQVGALPRQANVHLDRGYDSAVTRALLGGGAHSLVDERLWQATALHRKARHGRDFYLYLAAALVTLRMLIRRATRRYRWDGRPTTRRLK
jgi:hypothetical protein